MLEQKLHRAYIGSLIADALAMPVHWYYNIAALDRDYGNVDRYLAPKNPHPDSILFRSVYQALNEKGEILHRHARFWGQREVHYHQELEAGDNTLNFRLAQELHQQVITAGDYVPERWLETYIALLRDPEWNKDTYLEEYHRAFFTNLARGKKPTKCGIDDKHIGGLAHVPALLAALARTGEDRLDFLRSTVTRHIELTHQNRGVIAAGDMLVRMLYGVASGATLETAFEEESGSTISMRNIEKLAQRDEREVVGRIISPACYIEDSFPASCFLAWKYRDDFSGGIIANARVGGDSCHRGAVVGSLLAAANEIPDRWLIDKLPDLAIPSATGASENLTSAERPQQHHAGSIFRFRPDVPGVAPTPFAG